MKWKSNGTKQNWRATRAHFDPVRKPQISKQTIKTREKSSEVYDSGSKKTQTCNACNQVAICLAAHLCNSIPHYFRRLEHFSIECRKTKPK